MSNDVVTGLSAQLDCCISVLVYSPDMPSTIPMLELLKGLGKNIFRALRFWLHYTLVVVAWLGIVPLTACKNKSILTSETSI